MSSQHIRKVLTIKRMFIPKKKHILNEKLLRHLKLNYLFALKIIKLMIFKYKINLIKIYKKKVREKIVELE